MRPRGALAVLAVLVLGVATLWTGTDGLRAFTAEGAFRLSVSRHPLPLPDQLVLQDQDGRRFRLADYRGRRVLVEFFYTRCMTLCLLLGSGFQQLDGALLAGRAPGVSLLSISLDPADGLDDIAAYAARYHADGRRWRVARATNSEDLERLLKAFGEVRLPDPRGGFQHNAALDVVDPRGRLAAVLDTAKPFRALGVDVP